MIHRYALHIPAQCAKEEGEKSQDCEFELGTRTLTKAVSAGVWSETGGSRLSLSAAVSPRLHYPDRVDCLGGREETPPPATDTAVPDDAV